MSRGVMFGSLKCWLFFGRVLDGTCLSWWSPVFLTISYIMNLEFLAFRKNDHGIWIDFANSPFYRWCHPIHQFTMGSAVATRHSRLWKSRWGLSRRKSGKSRRPLAALNGGDKDLCSVFKCFCWWWLSDWETVFWCICSLVLNSFGGLRKHIIDQLRLHENLDVKICTCPSFWNFQTPISYSFCRIMLAPELEQCHGAAIGYTPFCDQNLTPHNELRSCRCVALVSNTLPSRSCGWTNWFKMFCSSRV